MGGVRCRGRWIANFKVIKTKLIRTSLRCERYLPRIHCLYLSINTWNKTIGLNTSPELRWENGGLGIRALLTATPLSFVWRGRRPPLRPLDEILLFRRILDLSQAKIQNNYFIFLRSGRKVWKIIRRLLFISISKLYFFDNNKRMINFISYHWGKMN